MSARLRGARVVAALLVAAGAVVVLAAPAAAHARMVGSDPAQGEVLTAVPAAVRVEFSDPLDPTAYVVVTGPDGSPVAEGEPEVDGRVVTQRLGDGEDGSYVVAVRAVSRDGHPITGRVEFVVGAPSAGTGDVPPAPAPAAAAGAGDTGPAGGPFGWPPWVSGVAVGCFVGAAGLWVASRRAA